VNHYDRQRGRRRSAARLDASEWGRRLAAEAPPPMASPELTEPTDTEAVEEAEREARYLASREGLYYAPGELGALRRSQRQD
jgi:hypothetical protein